MPDWHALLLEPEPFDASSDSTAWFDAIARRLLCGCRLVVGGEQNRITEIEIYYHGRTLLDPFSYREPIQKGMGQWYFHCTHGVYRGGSFKGVDLTFGGPDAYGGILIRGIESAAGILVDGPSLCVDHLLAARASQPWPRLDEAIARRFAWDSENPLHLQWLPRLAEYDILKTARVGLSLKRQKPSLMPLDYLLRRYRYLSEPRRIRKGKLHMALALHADGFSPAEIRERTSSTNAAIVRWIASWEEGRGESDFTRYFGNGLRPMELARLHGQRHARQGK